MLRIVHEALEVARAHLSAHRHLLKRVDLARVGLLDGIVVTRRIYDGARAYLAVNVLVGLVG